MGRRVAVLCSALIVVVLGPARGADDKDAKAIQGTWAYTSMEWNGRKLPAEQIKTSTITFDGDKFTIKRGDKVASAGTHKFDSTKTPKTFDATITEGEGKGNVLLGIYKLDGDTMTGCINLTGRERPTEFKTVEATETVLVVVKRAKK